MPNATKVPIAEKITGLFKKSPGDGATKQPASQAQKKRKKKRLIIAGVVVVVAAAAGVTIFTLVGGKNTDTATVYTTEQAANRTIIQALTGSGTLEAADSYSVSTLVEGTVLTADFEEGDILEKDSVLYTIDSSDAANSIEKAQLSLDSSNRTYQEKLEQQSKLNVKATAAGTVLDIKVEVGDEVTAGQTIATVRNNKVMSLTVPFPSDDAAGFYVGQSATVTLDGSFETLNATVTAISGADTVLTGNMIVREVTLEVSNPGGITTTQAATATINNIGCSDKGTFEYKDEKTVTAEVAGTVTKVAVSEGDWVNSDSTLVVLSSSSLQNDIASAADSVTNAELSLDSQQKQLDDYTVTSPISGTVIDKNLKAGDTVESGDVLCTIYDLTYLTLTLDVDELDMANVSVGQEVTITADAVEGQMYTGTITKVSVAGTTSSGVTTYPVTIQIDKTDGLLPGMNVDATIVISQAEDVLAIPSAALVRGNMVLVTADSPSAANAAAADTAPEGYVYVSVETGISDDSYIQIKSGLTAEDVVAYQQASADTTTQTGFGMMGTPPSGGGGPPAGGGAPGGMGG